MSTSEHLRCYSTPVQVNSASGLRPVDVSKPNNKIIVKGKFFFISKCLHKKPKKISRLTVSTIKHQFLTIILF
jgi:hypothetical protein